MVSTRSTAVKEKEPKKAKKSKKDKEPKEPKEPTNYMKKYRKDPENVYREDRLKRIFGQALYLALLPYRNIISLQQRLTRKGKKQA